MKNEKERMMREDDENLSVLLKVPTYTIGAYTIDVQKRLLTLKGETKKLTNKELHLLILFAANANEFVDRKYALKTIWKDDNYYNARSMDVYICKLRKLLAEDTDVIIINIHGKGYKLITPSK
jgi:DNA-binding response OmpR family regulator